MHAREGWESTEGQLSFVLMSWSGVVSAFGLGAVYFIAAIPAGVAAGASAWVAGGAAWSGYIAGGLVVLLAGAPLRNWLVKKLKIPVERDPSKLIWRMWDKAGLMGLCLIAPVTIGPQATSVIALAMGERTPRIIVFIALGVAPWCAAFAVLTAWGVKLTD